jgi:hypothetical protein
MREAVLGGSKLSTLRNMSLILLLEVYSFDEVPIDRVVLIHLVSCVTNSLNY